MNFYPNEEVRDALKLLNFKEATLSAEESFSVLENVTKKFTNEKKYSFPLWDKLIEAERVQYKFAWELFHQILKDENVILFFEYTDDKTMFLIENGSVLARVFENCFKFKFYITDRDNTFLLAFNDHDYLIGCGRAIKWIKDIRIATYN